jgi:PAS domain S-box-containing protein
LSVAVNQLVIGLHEARLLSEQRRTASELDQLVVQRTAELAAANEELKLRAGLLQQIPVSAFTLNADGTPDFVNESWLKYSGQTLEFVRSKPDAWMAAVHPDDWRASSKSFWDGVRSGSGFAMASRLRRGADGAYRWHLNRAVPLHDAEGRILRFVGTSTDIEELKQSQESLRKSEATQAQQAEVRADVSAAFSTSDNLNIILNACAEAIVHHLGAAFARIWTLNESEKTLVLQASAGLYSRLDGTHARVPVGQLKIGRIAEEGRPHLTNYVPNDERVRDRDWAKREGMVAFAGYPLFVEGRVTGVLAMFARHPLEQTVLNALESVADIIAQGIYRKDAEKKLRRSEAFLATGQRLSRTGSFYWQMETGEITWSEELYRIFEFDQSTPVTLERIASRVPPEELPMLNDMIERAQRAASDFEYEHRLLMPDHSIKYVHLTAHADRDPQGRLVYIGAAQDITRRRLAEEALGKVRLELAHAARVTSLGELSASIAHEVNQPLAAVVTNANACLRWLNRATPNLDEAREAVQRIVRDRNRGSEVIGHIRALLKNEHPSRTWINLNEMVGETVNLAQFELSGTEVLTKLTEGLPNVPADRVQLQQVLLNLMMNAIDAMKSVLDRPRVLRLETRRHGGDAVLVAVGDSGVGLKPECMEKLFKTFYTTKPKGLGMGLSISRSIVESHGGQLWAEPNDGPGATFQFTLPVENGVIA